MTLTNDSQNLTHNESQTKFPRQTDIATICIYGLSLLSASLFLFIPVVNLLNPSPWQRYMGAIHGFASLFAVVIIAYVGHLAFPLLRGSSKILPQARVLSFWGAILAFGAIASGNWGYMRYRAPDGGASAWIKTHTPLVHYLFMEYHEFTVLFTLPLMVACAWIFWRYGESLMKKENRPILTATSLGMMAVMFFAIGGMVTGLNVARIHTL